METSRFLASNRGLYHPSDERDACGIGFIAHLRGGASRAAVEDGLEILSALSHRAACGSDPESGDGCGILVQLPHDFFNREAKRLGFGPLRPGRYGVGQVFLPQDHQAQKACKEIVTDVAREEGQEILGWREVPVDTAHLGPQARRVMPAIWQVFFRLRRVPPSAFERRLYVVRKIAGHRIHQRNVDPAHTYHMASLSSKTIVYKGLMLPDRLGLFYPDLQDPSVTSAIALVHSRFSTNTFPTWDLAQPLRYCAHNGEINTVQGNHNWMMARRSQLQSAKFGGSLERLFPIIVPGRSDSAQFDNMLELLHLGGRSLEHSIMMLIPEAWQNQPGMSAERRAFYEYTSSLMEPWDGPAAIIFSDGRVVGATLDRNGLRPARYTITTDHRVILASEAGVLALPADKVSRKGRLQPGKIFIADISEGRILDDDLVKGELTARWPYRRWLKENVFDLSSMSPETESEAIVGVDLIRLQRAFGYSDETIKRILVPMAGKGREPIGSMGRDTPLAVLSEQAPKLSSYFHQRFAQVTNPPIDPIRERLVMTLRTQIGPDGNTFDETPEQCHRMRLRGPILTNEEIARVESTQEGIFESARLSLLYPINDGPSVFESALTNLALSAQEAVYDGANVLILSDRGVDAEHAAIPALLALSSVHQHLVREGIRMQAGLVVESAEANEVHDFALLIGYGAAAVNPYLALDTLRALTADRILEGNFTDNRARYIQAIEYGLLKIMSKMGISSLQSYRGGHHFEAIGLSTEVINAHFGGTRSRISGLSLNGIERELLERHDRGFGRRAAEIVDTLPVGGVYEWRRRGERHQWNPKTIATLQHAARENDAEAYRAYANAINDENGRSANLRNLFDFRANSTEAVPISDVEPAADIVRRFVTGAMSFGSISAEAHETLAIAMNRIGGRSNSGEGGEESERYIPDANGDLRRSAIKQIASGRFGVTAHYLVNADDLQIKIAQGAKPGEGGQLPGHKVDKRIARVRKSIPGVTLISPPPHHDIYSIEDLAQLIYDLQCVNPAARISVKLVSEAGVGTIAAGVAKAHAEAIVIAGHDGGTGAAPLSSLSYAGVPWELGLAETHQVLVENNLRSRVRLQVDGGLRTGRDIVIAALLGAEEYGIATAALIASGCIMLRKCHLNTCSVGIATQDSRLRKRFQGKPEHIINFFLLLAEDVRQIMSTLGVQRIDDLIGKTAYLRQTKRPGRSKVSTLNLSAVLASPRGDGAHRFHRAVPWSLSAHLDHRILERAPFLTETTPTPSDSAVDEEMVAIEPIEITLPIHNTDRAVGAIVSGEIARRFGESGLPKDTIRVICRGSAGQSFGAFLASGITLELEGDANDYAGKGLSGGQIIVYPAEDARFTENENVIVGNTLLYGATSGELYASGMAGERFAVRNSGARAVVEGLGDHGCEYMTGGVVVVLGPTGRNFAAGMSGGIAYVFDRDQEFRDHCNQDMVSIEELVDESAIWLVHGIIEDHVTYTGSKLGSRILDNWELMVRHFVQVIPLEYKKILQRQRASRRPGTRQLRAIRSENLSG